ARYGRYITRKNGWFLEPQVGLSYGVTRAYDFRLSNGLKYAQDQSGILTGHAGVTLGRKYGQGSHSGEAYLKLATNHEFNSGSNTTMYAMQNSDNPSLNEIALASQKITPLAGRDTWYDVSLG
ncbi:autotransporter outer membrane beta-barrel domain-containing protein, partial [Pectinatus frisingensis]|uniref:autotransporter outer membrane beta-barrel domain-containing protein n=2 Tax=Pectinatus frisingensis TaxID=865 RepID=UPI0018C68CB8